MQLTFPEIHFAVSLRDTKSCANMGYFSKYFSYQVTIMQMLRTFSCLVMFKYLPDSDWLIRAKMKIFKILYHQLISRVSCQKGPTSHAYAWQIGPFWQHTLDIRFLKWVFCQYRIPGVYQSVIIFNIHIQIKLTKYCPVIFLRKRCNCIYNEETPETPTPQFNPINRTVNNNWSNAFCCVLHSRITLKVCRRNGLWFD